MSTVCGRGPVRAVAGLEFFSDLWPNLHHVLYAAAWQRRREAATEPGDARSPMARMPTPLVELVGSEAATWATAVRHYDNELAWKDLLFSPEMMRLNQALADGQMDARVDDGAVPAPLTQVLRAVEPVYRRRFWPDHDAINRRWIAESATRLAELAPTVVPRLAELFRSPWHAPVRVDAVWVGRREGAYTVLDPDHITVSTTAAVISGWTAAEIMLHEASHLLVGDLAVEIDRALGERSDQHRLLWHLVLFFLTGEAVREELALRGVEYVPYLEATGLFDRAWPHYRRAVESAWVAYLHGECTRAHAVTSMVTAL